MYISSSIGGKFRPVSNFTQLHALMRSCLLSLYSYCITEQYCRLGNFYVNMLPNLRGVKVAVGFEVDKPGIQLS